MNEIIKIVDKNIFAISADLLGLADAQLWVGHADGPTDYDHERVKREREEDKKSGKVFGIEAVDLNEKNEWYEINASSWPAGKYRMMIHSRAGVQAPSGTPVDMNDWGMEYSWPKISEETLNDLSKDQIKFIYRERNNRGFCFRIEILPDRTIVPAGEDN